MSRLDCTQGDGPRAQGVVEWKQGEDGFQEVQLEEWDEIVGLRTPQWIYRGQRASHKVLETTLERFCSRWGKLRREWPKIERMLFREFRRAYHQYARHIPEDTWIMEWFSLMQHYGAPTRLLDFSYSIYMAAYFAIEAARNDEGGVVWAVDGPWAARETQKLMAEAWATKEPSDVEWLRTRLQASHEEAPVKRLFLTEPFVPSVFPLNPFRLNERLRIQQGIFLVTGEVTKPFVENLQALPDSKSEKHVFKIVIPPKQAREGIKHLFTMGISRTTLFPGLDGYAETLNVYNPVVLDPIKW